MSDEQRQLNEVEEEQPTSMPEENENSTEGDLPEETSERTREQFEKLKARNAQLAEKVRQLETTDRKSVLDALRPSQTPQTPDLSQAEVDKIYDQAIDEEGSVDPAALKKLLKEANDRAKQAEAIAKQASEQARNYSINDQVTKVHEKFPQLDPNNVQDFNEDFYRLVQNELLGQMYAGKQENFMSAAEYVASKLNVSPPVNQTQQQRDQILATTNSKAKATAVQQDPDLMSDVMRDRPGALEELIRRSGI